MDITLFVPLVVIALLVLLLSGRAQLRKGFNAATADGVTLLALAVIVGVLALGMVVSLDIW